MSGQDGGAADHLLTVARPRPKIVVATLNRPDRLNALTNEMLDALRDLCSALRDDASARALILTGAGENFCSGYDVIEIGRIASLAPLELFELLDRQSRLIAALRSLPQAVIAAVDGVAVGAGLSLALAADIRLVTSRSRLQAPFVKLGLSGGDMGASWLLPRIAGSGFAAEMLLSGRFVHADEAVRQGIASRVVDATELHKAAVELAETIAGNSMASVALTKHILQANTDAPSLEEALKRECSVQVIAAKSPDLQEAVSAFRERRTPRFDGS